MSSVKSSYVSLSTSKLDQCARTPSGLVQHLHEMLVPCKKKFFDPCPPKWNPSYKWNGLVNQWDEYNYVNPPYSEVEAFFDKAIRQQDDRVSVFLIPVRFHTLYFQKALPHMRHVIVLSKRVAFIGYSKPLSVPLCVVVFGPPPKIKSISNNLLEAVVYFHSFENRSEATIENVEDIFKKEYGEGYNVIEKSLSATLESSDMTGDFCILCPARMDNHKIRDIVFSNKHFVVFINPCLKRQASDQSRFTDGSMIISSCKLPSFTHTSKHIHIVTPNTHNSDEISKYVKYPKLTFGSH